MEHRNTVVRVEDLMAALSTLDPRMPLVWADESRQELLTPDDIRLGGGNLWFFIPKPLWGMKCKADTDPFIKISLPAQPET